MEMPGSQLVWSLSRTAIMWDAKQQKKNARNCFSQEGIILITRQGKKYHFIIMRRLECYTRSPPATAQAACFLSPLFTVPLLTATVPLNGTIKSKQGLLEKLPSPGRLITEQVSGGKLQKGCKRLKSVTPSCCLLKWLSTKTWHKIVLHCRR